MINSRPSILSLPVTRHKSRSSLPRKRASIALPYCSLQETVLEELKRLGVQPKKSLGQNFLTSAPILSEIVEAASVKAGDCVLEIGPGLGVLTECLIEKGANVLAIEKDDVFAGHIKQKFAEVPHVTVVHDDIFKLRQLPQLLRTFQSAPGSRLKVVANIPYNITSDLLSILLPMRDVIQSLYLLLEEGAALRLTQARPGDKDYRAMSVIVGLYAQTRMCFSVSRQSFYPIPGVDSAVAEFVLHEQLDHRLPREEEAALIAFVSACFSMKRKTLVNNLKSYRFTQSEVEECLDGCGLPRLIRAEALDVEAFMALFECLRTH